jgi:hypothetical protein
MKKLLAIMVLGLFFSGNAYAETKNIGNGLSINIPSKYKYFEITARQIVSRFPDIGLDELDDDFGIGMNAKLIVIANNQKTIKFFDEVTSVTGIEKLTRKFFQPAMQMFEDPKFVQMIVKELQKVHPNKDFENMPEEEAMELFLEISQNPKMVKKIERMFEPIKKKLQNAYNFNKYTILLIGDKKADILSEIKNKTIDELVQIVKDGLNEIYETSKDPSLKGLKDLQFEIAKNPQGDLYLYSDDNVDSPYVNPEQNSEIFLTSHKNQIIAMMSICLKKCNGSTDFAEIISPSNLYKGLKVKTQTNSNTFDIASQLEQLNKLYKSGALTKDEFNKAKKKLLN